MSLAFPLSIAVKEVLPNNKYKQHSGYYYSTRHPWKGRTEIVLVSRRVGSNLLIDQSTELEQLSLLRSSWV